MMEITIRRDVPPERLYIDRINSPATVCPMARQAVAAGLGAFKTWSALRRVTSRKS
jgi:hypothetical protein